MGGKLPLLFGHFNRKRVATEWGNKPCNVGCHCQRLPPADSTGGNTAASLYTRAGIVGGWRNRAAGVGAAKHLENAGVRYTNIQNLQITGIYDAPTQKAVQNFQSLTARKPTGMVDRATWNLLVAAAECSSL